MLCGLGLELLCRLDVGDVGEVDAYAVVLKLPSELPYGFEEREAFDVAYHSAYFGDDEIEVASLAESHDVAFYLVGDVRYDLYGLSEVVSSPFLFDHALVYASCCDVVGACGGYISEPLVVPEIEVGFVSVDSDIAFAMLVGVECARIDVDVRVEFLYCGPVAASFEQTGKRG